MGWGVSKRTLSNTWSSLFLSAPLHVKTQKQSNRQKHDTLHQRSLTLLGSFWKCDVLREMWRDTINPHEISLSKNVYAQITIKVEFLPSSAIYKDGWHTDICLQVSSCTSAGWGTCCSSILWLWQSEFELTKDVTAVSNSALTSVHWGISIQQDSVQPC